MNQYSQKTLQGGMTLVEAVMLVGIYTLISLVILVTVTEFYRFNSYTVEQANEVENARRAMTQWNRDAKELNTGENGAYPIAVIAPHTFGYFSDTDLDNSVEYVEYRLATTTLRKYVYNATGTPLTYNTTPDSVETLSLFVQNINQSVPTFQYFDNVGTTLSSSSPIVNVRFIQAQFIINIDPNRSPGEFMLRSSIAPRNIKDNL